MKDYHHIGKYIGEIHRASTMYFGKRASKFGIGAGQFFFLLNLYKRDGIAQEELTEKLNLDKGTTARAIKKLEDEGYLNRVKNENDRRAYRLKLTEKAEQIREEVFAILDEWEIELRSCLNDDECETLFYLLNKLSKEFFYNKEDIYEESEKIR